MTENSPAHHKIEDCAVQAVYQYMRETIIIIMQWLNKMAVMIITNGQNSRSTNEKY